MKSMLVIGLGQFGYNLALKLSELGNEVLAVDTNEEKVSQIAPYVTGAKIADCQEEEVLRDLGVRNFDVCFVAIAGDFQASLEITSTLHELGANYVVSKAERERQSKILSKIGADNVIHSDVEMADRIAVKYSVNNAFDYIEFSENYAISEILVPTAWVGKDLIELDVRNKFNINVIAHKTDTEDETADFVPIVSAGYKFIAGEHILIAGDDDDIIKMTGM